MSTLAKVVLGACLSLYLSLPAVAAPQASACARGITLGANHWEPYSFFDARNEYMGIDADMARAIFKEAGCKLVVLPDRPAPRNMALFEAGEIDMLTGASHTEDRLRFARFTEPYRNEKVGLFALQERAARHSAVRSFDDFLSGAQTLLAPRAGWYGAEYERRRERLRADKRLFLFLDFAQGLRMLEVGRADFILGDSVGLAYAASRQGVKISPLPVWTVQAPVHLMLNRSTVSEADVRRLDAAIRRLQKKGEFDRIRLVYGSP